MEFLLELLAILQPEQGETTFKLAHPSAWVKLHCNERNEQPSPRHDRLRLRNLETEVKAIGTLARDRKFITPPFLFTSAPKDSIDLINWALVRASYGR